MLSVEATGRNVEQAISNALFELKASREDVDIKILDEGGLFKKAKVRVSISPDEIEKYQKREKKEENLTDSQEKNKEEVDELNKETALNDLLTKEEDVEEEIEILNSSKNQNEKEKDLEKAQKFIQGLLNRTTLTGNVECVEENDEIHANIIGYSDIIGYRGEGLNSLQYLTSVVISKNNRHAKKVRVDCDNYRARREAALIALAQRMARKVEKTHSSVKLEPMTANERRIMHTALSNSQTVETFSKGEEPHRYLIIKPKY